MNQETYQKYKGIIFFDFDSTLYFGETLELLLEYCLRESENKNELMKKINAIGDLGMNGSISVIQSIKQRLEIANINLTSINNFLKQAKPVDTPVIHLINKIKHNKWLPIIISNGFKEIIIPLSSLLPIRPSQIYANRFYFDKNQNVSFSKEISPLVYGKYKIIREFKKKSNYNYPIVMVGDSITDLVAKKPEGADFFVAWRIYKKRSNIIKLADLVIDHIENIEDLLFFINKINYKCL